MRKIKELCWLINDMQSSAKAKPLVIIYMCQMSGGTKHVAVYGLITPTDTLELCPTKEIRKAGTKRRTSTRTYSMEDKTVS